MICATVVFGADPLRVKLKPLKFTSPIVHPVAPNAVYTVDETVPNGQFAAKPADASTTRTADVDTQRRMFTLLRLSVGFQHPTDSLRIRERRNPDGS